MTHPSLSPSTTSGDGGGVLAATASAAYDNIGDMVTVDGPLSGSDDTTTLRYDALRRRVGAISPDPDGPTSGTTGTMLRRAQRTTYASTGLVSQVDQGTVTGTSDSDWAAFAVLQSVSLNYDANRRLQRQSLLSSSAAVQAVRDLSYDNLGRPYCATVRMDPSTWGTLTAACTQQSAGIDRISINVHNLAGQVVQQIAAYATADAAIVAASAYTNNGRLETLTDGNGNVTSYAYDGHDRLRRTCYPGVSLSVCPTTTGTGFEQYDRDANGNVTLRWLRDGNWIINTYDALNRLTTLNTPNLNWSDADTAYSYDLLGRLTAAEPDTGFDVTMTYDALGRRTSETSYYGTKSFQYDLAGRMTRLTWNDGFYASYDHLVTGEVTHVRENGATSGVGVLATYAYDDLGRRTLVTRGNGTSAGFTYDAASRLDELAETIPGASSGQTIAFDYNRAGQITSRATTNSAYAYTARVNGSAADDINGLNQVTETGATTVSHDGRGNITAIGSTSYQYTSQNRIADAQGALLAYDGLGRLAYAGYWPNGDRLDMAGHSLIAQVDSGNAVLRRYVHGPDADEPIVWYEGSGTTDRRFLHADERGSIVAVSDSSGAVTNVNSYDEYGVPAAGNVGRFGYTGQHWIPSANAWYYRARFYHPTLGRFMQTDPIGFGGGMNLYAYVGGDPMNLIDSSGLRADCPVQPCGGTIDAWGTRVRRGASANLINFSNTPPDWNWADNRDHDMERAREPSFSLITVTAPRIQLACAGPVAIPCLAIGSRYLYGRALAALFGTGYVLSDHGLPPLLQEEIDRGDTPPERPPGVPEDWRPEGPNQQGSHKFVDPTNRHNYVRVRPDGTITQVRNGQALDRYGNPAPRQNSPEAHYPRSLFRFRN